MEYFDHVFCPSKSMVINEISEARIASVLLKINCRYASVGV